MQHPFCRCPEPTSCTCPTNWALCRHCGAAITWARSGKIRIPLNGHVRVTEFSYTGHTSHLLTCAGESSPQPTPSRQRNFIAEAEIARLKQLRETQRRTT